MIRSFLKILTFLCVAQSVSPIHAANLYLGIDALEARGFDLLEEKRVGLLTHPAGVNSKGIWTRDILANAGNVNLVKLFGPEHGLYGTEKANDPIKDKRDPATGLPVYSLYGQYRTPTPAMLQGLDAMVIDLQDIGTRSYTYISSMRLTMQACFENGVEVIILDRPNPLGGLKVDGPILDPELRSYVGAFPIPYLHGLTIGELAMMAKDQVGWLEIPRENRIKGKLTIVPMRGWKRSMTWGETGLRWIPTSPLISSPAAVLGYAMTGLGTELNGFQHGYGTPHPFRLLRHKGIYADDLIRHLATIPHMGLRFEKRTVSNQQGKPYEGVYTHLDDWNAIMPVEFSFHMMILACRIEGGNPYADASENAIGLFKKHMGDPAWWKEISTHGSDARLDRFLRHWRKENQAFVQKSRKYWLYPP